MGLKDKILSNTPQVIEEIVPTNTVEAESNIDSTVFKINKILNALRIVEQKARDAIRTHTQTKKNIEDARQEISEVLREVNLKNVSNPLSITDILSNPEYSEEGEIVNLKALEESRESTYDDMVDKVGKRDRVMKFAFNFLINLNSRISSELSFDEIVKQLEKEKDNLLGSGVEQILEVDEIVYERTSQELKDEIELIHKPKSKKSNKPPTSLEIADTITITNDDFGLFVTSGEAVVTSEIKNYYKRFFSEHLNNKHEKQGLKDVDFLINKINTYQQEIDIKTTEVNVLKMRVLRLAKKIEGFFGSQKGKVVDDFLDHITSLGLTPIEAFLSNKSIFTSPVTFMGPEKLDHKSDPTQILDGILKSSKTSFDELLKSKNWENIDQLYNFSRLDNLIKQQGIFYEELESMFSTPENVLLNIDLDSLKETKKTFEEYNQKDKEINSQLPIYLEGIKPAVAKKIKGLSLDELLEFQKKLEDEYVKDENELNGFIDAQVEYKIAKAKEERFKQENAEEIAEMQNVESSKLLLQTLGNEYFDKLFKDLDYIKEEQVTLSEDYVLCFTHTKLHSIKTYTELIKQDEKRVAQAQADIQNIKDEGVSVGDGFLNSKKKKRDYLISDRQQIIGTSNNKIATLKNHLKKVETLALLNDFIKKLKNNNFGKFLFPFNKSVVVSDVINIIRKVMASHEPTPAELKLKDALTLLENNTQTTRIACEKIIPSQEPPLKNSTSENKPITQKKPTATFEVGKEHKISEERYQELNRKFLSYQDAPYESNPLFTKELAAEYRESGLKSDDPNKRGGAAVLDRLIKQYGEKKIIEVAIKMITECKEVLNKIHAKHSVFLSSMTWALWDISKQIYFNEHPELTNKNYRTGNALEDPQIMRDLINRQIGWETVGGGNIDVLNLNKNHPTYKTIKDFINMVNKKEKISSWQLTKIGQAVRENIASLG